MGGISRDRLLTNVMLYWLTASAGSSARLYGRPSTLCDTRPHTLHNTTGIAVFATDLARPLRSPVERDNHIVHRCKFDRGGHFAALEQPEPFVQDVQTFFRRFGTPSH
jgi:epoxide hydrolase